MGMAGHPFFCSTCSCILCLYNLLRFAMLHMLTRSCYIDEIVVLSQLVETRRSERLRDSDDGPVISPLQLSIRYRYSSIQPVHPPPTRKKQDYGNKMSELDLDEIYNFTIKLARDVSTITVPHLPPPTFPIYL